jgi:hypothetical protein
MKHGLTQAQQHRVLDPKTYRYPRGWSKARILQWWQQVL